MVPRSRRHHRACLPVVFLFSSFFWGGGREQIAVLDPRLEAIRMEASNHVVEGTVEDVTRAVKQLMVGAKVLRAKKAFLTTLDSVRGKLH